MWLRQALLSISGLLTHRNTLKALLFKWGDIFGTINNRICDVAWFFCDTYCWLSEIYIVVVTWLYTNGENIFILSFILFFDKIVSGPHIITKGKGPWFNLEMKCQHLLPHSSEKVVLQSIIIWNFEGIWGLSRLRSSNTVHMDWICHKGSASLNPVVPHKASKAGLLFPLFLCLCSFLSGKVFMESDGETLNKKLLSRLSKGITFEHMICMCESKLVLGFGIYNIATFDPHYLIEWCSGALIVINDTHTKTNKACIKVKDYWGTWHIVNY